MSALGPGSVPMIARVLGLMVALIVAGPAASAEEKSRLVAQGKRLFTEHGCYGCHTLGKTGTPIAPDLSRVGSKHPQSYLVHWLRDPSQQKPTAHMPKIQLRESEAQALAAYLASLR